MTKAEMVMEIINRQETLRFMAPVNNVVRFNQLMQLKKSELELILFNLMIREKQNENELDDLDLMTPEELAIELKEQYALY